MVLTIGFDATAAAHQAAGIGRYARHLLASLGARDDDFEYRAFYCARGAGSGYLPSLDARFRVRGIPMSDRYLNFLLHRMNLPLPVQLVTGSIDLFHAPDFVVPPTLRRPSLLTIHDLAFLRVPECAYPTLRVYLERVVPRAAARATKIIAVSENTRRDVIDLFAVDPDKVVTIPEGVDPSFRPLPETEYGAPLERLGVERPFVLAVGTLEPRKNYVRLLEAFKVVHDRFSDLVLVIAGAPGWLYDPIYQRLAELKLNEHVIFTTPKDADLVALYNAAQVFVYPSLYEGFGLPPLEALACGAPVACSKAASLPEVVGDAAVQFNPLSVEEIAHALCLLLDDGSLRSDLRRRGPARAAQYSWPEAARKTADLYRQMAADA